MMDERTRPPRTQGARLGRELTLPPRSGGRVGEQASRGGGWIKDAQWRPPPPTPPLPIHCGAESPTPVPTAREGRGAEGACMPIDVHAHYVPPQLIAAIDARGADIGVRLVRARGRDARAAFRLRLQGAAVLSAADRTGGAAPRLARPAGHRPADRRHLAGHLRLWPAAEACIAWHRMLNDTLAEWCADNKTASPGSASVPLTAGRGGRRRT